MEVSRIGPGGFSVAWWAKKKPDGVTEFSKISPGGFFGYFHKGFRKDNALSLASKATTWFELPQFASSLGEAAVTEPSIFLFHTELLCAFFKNDGEWDN